MQGGCRHHGCSQHLASRSLLCSCKDEAYGKASPAPQKWPDPSLWHHPTCPTAPILLTKHHRISVPQSHVPWEPMPRLFPHSQTDPGASREAGGKKDGPGQGPARLSRWGCHFWCCWTNGTLFVRDPLPGHSLLLRVEEALRWWALGMGDGHPVEGGL